MSTALVSPDAAQDLHDIWAYVADDKPDTADRFLNRLNQQIKTLGENPGMGHLREGLADDKAIFF